MLPVVAVLLDALTCSPLAILSTYSLLATSVGLTGSGTFVIQVLPALIFPVTLNCNPAYVLVTISVLPVRALPTKV